jgi:serine/threonine protein kinase
MPEPIIHQDIKPDNILVDDNNRFLITDFGISKKIRSTMRKQSKRAVGAGATAYMGPERFESDPSPVKASDIWSLGVSIHELATGVLPFSGLGGGMQRNGAEMPSLDNKWSKELNMVMQSCLAKETWDRPTAEQLETYSQAILDGHTANATWNVPSSYITSQEQSDTIESNYGASDDTDEQVSNKKRTWYAIGGIILAVILLILVWPSNTNNEPLPTTEDEIVDEDTVTSEAPRETIEVPEVKSQNEKQIETKTETKTVKSQEEKPFVKKEEPTVDNNASLLKEALSSGDYQQVQKLANQGYAAAYGPLAKYYLNNHDYKTAETYAKKAKAAGYSDGASVLKTLENLGYYD